MLNEGTLALNWYWNQFTRVQFNIIFCNISSQYVLPHEGQKRLMEAYTMALSDRVLNDAGPSAGHTKQ